MKNEAVTTISEWKESNDDEECNESEYLERALEYSDGLNAKIAEAINGLSKP
jgi:hypothetical protein